jgi:hypothetical protein
VRDSQLVLVEDEEEEAKQEKCIFLAEEKTLFLV